MAAPRLLLFDVDGTLVDTSGAGRRAMEHACRELFGIERIEARAGGVRYAGMTDPVIIEHVAAAIGLSPETTSAKMESMRAGYLEALRREMAVDPPRGRVLPGVCELLDALEVRDDVHLGLVTGNLESGARVKLEAFGLNRFFAGGGFACDHRDRPEIARIGWRRMCDVAGIEFAPEDVVIIGDTEHDVTCARANGFRAVAVESGWVPREELAAAAPDALLPDLADLDASLRALGV